MNQRDRVLVTVAIVLLVAGLAVVHGFWSLAPIP